MVAVAADTDFQAQLLALRKRLKLDQWEFAEQLGVSRSTYKNWEYGQSIYDASGIRP